MTDVGVRELKRDLSNYLKRAAAGEEIRVTMRGEPLVALTAVAADAPAVDPVAAQWEALFASGRVERASAPKPDYRSRRTFRMTTSPVDEILADRAGEDA